jgi:Ca2+/Na+ antiporter
MPDQQDNSQGMREVVFSWKHPEYVKYKKNAIWYLLSFVAVFLMVAWAIYTVNYLFAVFLVLFYLVVIIHEFRDPQEVNCILTHEGVKHDSKFFFYNQIDDFFIIYQDQGVKNLYLDFKNPLRGRLIIDLEGQDAVSIREFLLQFLKEDLDREVEPISERFRRLLKL